MIINNNKKCNISINETSKNGCEYYTGIGNLTDYIPELKEFEKNGLRLETVSGNGCDELSFTFEKIIKNKSVMSVCVTIFFEEGKTYSKEYILDLLKSQLEGFYDKDKRLK